MTRPATRLLFCAVTIVVVLGSLELLAWPVLALLGSNWRFDMSTIAERFEEQSRLLNDLIAGQGRLLLKIDAELGWVMAPNYSGTGYSTNSQGLRGTREYSPRPAAGVIRVAAFGDSFVFGNEVRDKEAWSIVAEQMEPRLEVLNYGAGGYGPDQALMLYRRRGREFAPRVVVLGFPEVDLARVVNRYQRFLRIHAPPLFKPRFELDPAGELRLIPNPFPGESSLRKVLADPSLALQASVRDEIFDPLVWRNPLYDHSRLVRVASTVASRAWRVGLRPDRLDRGNEMNRDSEAFHILVQIVRTFAREVVANGETFVFVIFPMRDADIWGGGRRSYATLVEALPDITILDLADPLRADPQVTPATMRAPNNHYSGLANRTTARALVELLRTRGLL